MTKNYTVSGMTCQHCVASVTEELEEIPGVQGVNVDLSTGRVSVDGTNFTDAQVADAIETAGYTLQA